MKPAPSRMTGWQLFLPSLLWLVCACAPESGLQHPPADFVPIGGWHQDGRGQREADSGQSETDPDGPAGSPVDAAAEEPWEAPEPLHCTAPGELSPVASFFSKPCADPDLCPCNPADLGEVTAALMGQARESILVSVMELQDFSISKALIAARKRGLSVKVILDDGYSDPLAAKAVADLLAAGIEVVDDADPALIMHAKFAVLDRQTVLIGSANYSTFDALSNANNLVALRAPETAALLANRFDALWGAGGFHKVAQPGPFVAALDGGQVELLIGPHWALLDRLVKAIEGATKSIHFSIFALTAKEVRQALDKRCGQVELVGLYDAQQDSDPNSVVASNWCPAALVLPAKVAPTPGVAADFGFLKLHHKVLIVDGEQADQGLVVTGSANWSYSAATKNDEVMVVLSHPATVAAFESEFQARLAEAKE